MSYWTIIKFIGPYLIVAIFAGFSVWFVMDLELTNEKEAHKLTKHNLEVCQNVNTTNDQTIKALNEDIKKQVSACDKRVRICHETLNQIQTINNTPVSDLPVILNGLFPSDRKD